MVGFFVLFLSFGFINKWSGVIYITSWSAVLSHLSLLPVVAALPAPAWARVGGYTWAVFDTILAIATLHGVPIASITPWRLGLHVAAAIWPLGAALTNTGAVRWAGFLLSGALGVVPLLGPSLPPEAMMIAVPFIFLWLGVVGWKLKKS
jgi:hypothetical protein